MEITTYNPRKVTIAFGSHVVKGLADDSFVAIEPVGDGTTYVVGAYGEVARSVDPSCVYNIKVTLLQTSETNAWLKSMYDKDRKNGEGTFAVTIKDVLGGEKFSGTVAWVAKSAPWSRGKQASTREWEIVVGEGKFK